MRNAYFTLLVDIETLVVTRALAQFSDEIYRLQIGLAEGHAGGPYEPAALRAQAFTNRLAYKQAIASYIYDWKALVATLGLHQLPLSEVAGRVDRFIPYYDYDEVLAYVLQNHTDVLTARNDVKSAQYLLKLAQVTPLFPDLDVQLRRWRRTSPLAPFGTYQTLALGFPLPIWDQNKGNIIAAQAGAGPCRRRIAPRRGHPDQQPGHGLRRLQEQPVRHGVLPPLHPARPGPLLPRRLRTPPDRPELGLRRPGVRPAEPGDERQHVHRHPRARSGRRW